MHLQASCCLVGAGSEQRMVVPLTAGPHHCSLYQELLNLYSTVSASFGHLVKIDVTSACRVLFVSVCFVITVEGCLVARVDLTKQEASFLASSVHSNLLYASSGVFGYFTA